MCNLIISILNYVLIFIALVTIIKYINFESIILILSKLLVKISCEYNCIEFYIKNTSFFMEFSDEEHVFLIG